jgi:hypothetical protein
MSLNSRRVSRTMASIRSALFLAGWSSFFPRALHMAVRASHTQRSAYEQHGGFQIGGCRIENFQVLVDLRRRLGALFRRQVKVRRPDA